MLPFVKDIAILIAHAQSSVTPELMAFFQEALLVMLISLSSMKGSADKEQGRRPSQQLSSLSTLSFSNSPCLQALDQ